MPTRTYLDHNATTPLAGAARAAMTAAMDIAGNPSSVHGDGRAARRIVEDARETVAEIAGAEPGDVIFTAGGTEANNLALRGFAAGSVLVSAVEHPSVLQARSDSEVLPVDADGVVDLTVLEARLRDLGGGVLVSVMAANNETGILQPIAEVAEIIGRHGAVLHVDASQAAGKMPMGAFQMADLLTFSAHKLGGPAGVGALIVRHGAVREPLIKGGGQERRRRAGSENVIGIAGFAAAAGEAGARTEAMIALRRLRDAVEAELIVAGALVHGAAAVRLPNTSSVSMPGVTAETQVMAFDLAGISVSAGSACSSGKVEPSHVLKAMGLDDRTAERAIRVSFGIGNTEADAERFIDTWKNIHSRAGKAAAA